MSAGQLSNADSAVIFDLQMVCELVYRICRAVHTSKDVGSKAGLCRPDAIFLYVRMQSQHDMAKPEHFQSMARQSPD